MFCLIRNTRIYRYILKPIKQLLFIKEIQSTKYVYKSDTISFRYSATKNVLFRNYIQVSWMPINLEKKLKISKNSFVLLVCLFSTHILSPFLWSIFPARQYFSYFLSLLDTETFFHPPTLHYHWFNSRNQNRYTYTSFLVLG